MIMKCLRKSNSISYSSIHQINGDIFAHTLQQLLEQIKKLDFPLNGRQVKYDENGDPTVSFAVIRWNTETNPPLFDMVGIYDKNPEITFTINNSLLSWHNNGSVRYPIGEYLSKHLPDLA